MLFHVHFRGHGDVIIVNGGVRMLGLRWLLLLYRDYDC